jgi:hypothetical protein
MPGSGDETHEERHENETEAETVVVVFQNWQLSRPWSFSDRELLKRFAKEDSLSK